MDQAVIAAGVGCRRGASGEMVVTAVEAALAAYGIARGDVDAMATSVGKAAEPGVAEAAAKLGIPLVALGEAVLRAAAGATLTRSPHSLAATGLPSLSEAAALAAAGPRGRLLGPRLARGPVTCALAKSADAP